MSKPKTVSSDSKPSHPSKPEPIASTAITIQVPKKLYTNVTYAFKVKHGKDVDVNLSKYCFLRSQEKLSVKEEVTLRTLSEKYEPMYGDMSPEERENLVALYDEAMHVYNDDNIRYTKEKAEYVQKNPTAIEASKAIRQISKEMNEEARRTAKEKSVSIDFAIDVTRRITALREKLIQAKAEYDEKERAILAQLTGEVMSAVSDHTQQIQQRVTREFTERMAAKGSEEK